MALAGSSTPQYQPARGHGSGALLSPIWGETGCHQRGAGLRLGIGLQNILRSCINHAGAGVAGNLGAAPYGGGRPGFRWGFGGPLVCTLAGGSVQPAWLMSPCRRVHGLV